MCKNTRISGLKLLCWTCQQARHCTRRCPGLFFVVVMTKTWKFFPEISTRKVKKCAPLEKLFYSFGATAGIDCSLQRVGKTIYAVCYETGADPGFFWGRGALVSCSTSTPINHIVFFWQNTSCIRNPRVISGGGAHPLHPPPRYAPAKRFPQTVSTVSVNLA